MYEAVVKIPAEDGTTNRETLCDLKACFKRRATAVVLSWLDCGSTVARLQHDTSTTWFQTSNLIQSNRTAIAGNKIQK